MVIYEVNLTVDAEIADDYAAWLGPHIKEILEVDGFLSVEWFEVETEDEEHRLRRIPEFGNRILRVVVKHGDPPLVVTAFFDRSRRNDPKL